MSKISPEEVLKIGTLARLEIAPEELAPLAEHFNSILEYFATLENLDLTGVDPFTVEDAQPMGLRDDAPADGGHREAILAQSPSREGNFIRVPRIGGGK